MQTYYARIGFRLNSRVATRQGPRVHTNRNPPPQRNPALRPTPQPKTDLSKPTPLRNLCCSAEQVDAVMNTPACARPASKDASVKVRMQNVHFRPITDTSFAINLYRHVIYFSCCFIQHQLYHRFLNLSFL